MYAFRSRRSRRSGGRLSYEDHLRDRSRIYEEELRSENFVVVDLDPARTLRFLGEREILFYPQATVDALRNRRTAQLSFYRSCSDRTLDLHRNPYLDWMRTHHPNGGWHRARSDSERVEICIRHRDLFVSIEKNGIEMPLRILQEKHFHLRDVARAADGGNRLQIAMVLGISRVPNLIRRDLIAEAQAHGLI